MLEPLRLADSPPAPKIAFVTINAGINSVLQGEAPGVLRTRTVHVAAIFAYIWVRAQRAIRSPLGGKGSHLVNAEMLYCSTSDFSDALSGRAGHFSFAEAAAHR